jgi:hypothetical protein
MATLPAVVDAVDKLRQTPTELVLRQARGTPRLCLPVFAPRERR